MPPNWSVRAAAARVLAGWRRARQLDHTRDSPSFTAQPALLVTCATTMTRPASAPSGPGGGRKRQQGTLPPGRPCTGWPGAHPSSRTGSPAGSEMVFDDVIEKIGMIIDAAGVVVIVAGAAGASVVTAVRVSRRESAVYLRFRQQLGQAILLGLELLVAGDIVRTVAASPQPDRCGDTGGDRPDPHLPE